MATGEWIGEIDEWMQRALIAEAEVGQLTRERDHYKALTESGQERFRQGRNWLRQQANSEKNPDKLDAFIEAHNALLAIANATD